MAIAFGASRAWAYAASGSVTPTLATHASGDLLLVQVAYKSSAIATCAASTATSGWAKVSTEYHGGTTNSGNGTGSVAIAVFWKVAASSSETAPTITFSQTVTQVGHTAHTYTKAGSETWVTPVGDGGTVAASTSYVITVQSHVSAKGGDMIVVFFGSADDSAFSTGAFPNFQQTGITISGVNTKAPATAGLDASGADGSYDSSYVILTSGTSSAAAVLSTTIAAAEAVAAWETRLRVVQSLTIPQLDGAPATYAPTVIWRQFLTLPVLERVGTQTVFLDQFTGTNGTALTGHAPDTIPAGGASVWSTHGVNVIPIQGNKASAGAAADTAYTAKYDVLTGDGTFTFDTVGEDDTVSIVEVRADSTIANCIRFTRFGDSWELSKVIAAVTTQIDGGAGLAQAALVIKLVLNGTSLELWLGLTQQGTYTVPVSGTWVTLQTYFTLSNKPTIDDFTVIVEGDPAPSVFAPTVVQPGAAVPPAPFRRDNRLVQQLAH